MTNYNDGKWHGWNDGECPVHPKTEVEAVCISVVNGSRIGFGLAKPTTAGCMSWEADNPSAIVAFRVVNEYREPREFWIVAATGDAWETEARAKTVAEALVDPTIIHVREVLE